MYQISSRMIGLHQHETDDDEANLHNKLNLTRNEIIEELNKMQSTIDFISSPTTISNEMGFV